VRWWAKGKKGRATLYGAKKTRVIKLRMKRRVAIRTTAFVKDVTRCEVCRGEDMEKVKNPKKKKKKNPRKGINPRSSEWEADLKAGDGDHKRGEKERKSLVYG